MGNVKMEPVCASRVGMGSTVRWKGVLIAAQRMDNVGLILTACGSVDVIMVGMVKTVVFYWNKVATITKTMTKVSDQAFLRLCVAVTNVFVKTA